MVRSLPTVLAQYLDHQQNIYKQTTQFGAIFTTPLTQYIDHHQRNIYKQTHHSLVQSLPTSLTQYLYHHQRSIYKKTTKLGAIFTNDPYTQSRSPAKHI